MTVLYSHGVSIHLWYVHGSDVNAKIQQQNLHKNSHYFNIYLFTIVFHVKLACQSDNVPVGGFSYAIAPTIVNITTDNNAKIVQIAIGDNHVLALDSLGMVYAAGSNAQYQLGIEAYSGLLKVTNFTQVPFLRDVTQVAAGSEHSLALRLGGTVVAWGSNSKVSSTIHMHS